MEYTLAASLVIINIEQWQLIEHEAQHERSPFPIVYKFCTCKVFVDDSKNNREFVCKLVS